VSGAGGRVVLVETSDLLPGLLPFQAWEVLSAAGTVLCRDPATHPSASALALAGLPLAPVAPAALGREDLLLTRPGGPDDRRLAKALVAAARDHGTAVYLLEDDERGLAPALSGMVAAHDVEIELVFLAQLPRGTELLRAVDVMDRLRDPVDGCPWDLEQDHASLVRYLVEETYELLDAVATGDDDDVREELGDVLLQVLFHARIAAERGAFGVDDVARGLVDKLVRRHPHVFGDGERPTDADGVQRAWDAIKAEEGGGRGPLDGIPAAMPGLALLDALLRRLRRERLVPTDAATVRADLRATLAELDALDTLDERDEATPPDGADQPADGAPGPAADALGRLLVQAAGLAAALGLDADAVARTAAARLRADAEAALAGPAVARGDVWPRG
jgi:XTP/dITP diphosphohydrolase